METIETLGKYEIRRTLGRGAMGTVYEGWDPTIQRHVAIKTVQITDATDPETEEQLARFRREAQAAGRLVHPNIVTVHDYGETSELAYIVMEYVEGPTLKSLMEKQERFALPDILRIMRDVLDGLEFSHERGVVHRDIKPANVMLTSADRDRSRAKIADFGIARIESSSMTQAGTIMGTPTYMSPEQFMGQPVDRRTDIYSAGVMLYQLLTGERPFEGSMSAIMHKALNTEAPAPSQISVTTPPAFDAVVARAMAKRPDDRYPSAAAFAKALQAAAENPDAGNDADATMVDVKAAATIAPAPAPPPPAPPARKRSSVPILAAVSVAVLAAGGGAAYVLLAPTAPPPAPRLAAISPSAPLPATPAAPPVPEQPAPAQPAPPQPAPAPAALPRAETPALLPRAEAPTPLPRAEAPATPAVTEPAPEPTRVATPGMIRDQLAQIVAAQPCSLIDGTVRGGGETIMTGIAAQDAHADIRRLIADRAIPASLDWRVESADSSFCPALELLRSVAPGFGSGEPRLTLGLANDRTRLRDGEHIRPYLVMPGFAGYLRVDYIARDGNVQHLYPQVADPAHGIAADPARSFAAAERVKLGEPPPGQPAWEAGEPYGTDMIIAVASSRPLFDRPRPANVERAADYLRDMEAAMQAIRGGGARMVGNAILLEALPK